MDERKQKRPADSSLDAPSEANRSKHINFRDVEEESAENFTINRDEAKQRREQWQEGLREGERKKELGK